MKIGLVSDTHLPTTIRRLPDGLLDRLAGVDWILHAGDLVSADVLDRLRKIAPTTAVVGNMDPPELAARLASREILQLSGRTIGLQHGHQRSALQDRYIGLPYDAPEFELFYQAMVAQLPGAEIVVFGHFHTPVVREWKGILFVNPGSIAPPHRRLTFGILELGETVEARILNL
jgi:hypothetical protein